MFAGSLPIDATTYSNPPQPGEVRFYINILRSNILWNHLIKLRLKVRFVINVNETANIAHTCILKEKRGNVAYCIHIVL